MKTKGKAWQLVVTVLLIVVFVYTAFFGVAAKYGDVTTTYIKGAKDIRFGVDIKGGVNVTFVPSDGYDATDEQLDAARLVIENRLVALNVTDYELYVDNNSDSLILEFPWQSGETDFDPESAIQEIGTTAYLTFREEILPQPDNYSSAVSRTIRYLQQNHTGEATLIEAAEQVHLNPAYLSHIFSKETGITFSEYLLSCRLGTAKELLVNTDDKIREVSAKSGFNDYRNFCKVFKKTVGETPQNYRKQCRTK